MIKIVIVDDHSIVREGIKLLIEAHHDMQVIGEATDAATGLALIKAKRPDVVVLDVGLPGRSGLEVLMDLKQEPSRPAVLILSMYPEGQMAVRAFRSGASGYLTKGSLPEELATALRKVAGGGKYISAQLAEELAGKLQADDNQAPHEKLSEREYVVLCKIAGGKTTTEIAEDLSLSLTTVSTYRARILEKLHLKTTADLIQYAIRHKLSPLDPTRDTPA